MTDQYLKVEHRGAVAYLHPAGGEIAIVTEHAEKLRPNERGVFEIAIANARQQVLDQMARVELAHEQALAEDAERSGGST